MKNKLFFILIILLLVLFAYFINSNKIFILSNKNQLKIEKIFVGHAYGTHGDLKIPDESFKKFLDQHKPKFIIFGGDLTEKPNDYPIFKNYLEALNIKNLIIRGNHDEKLWDYENFWKFKTIEGDIFFNLDMNEDYKFNHKVLKKHTNTYFLSHFVWFNQLIDNIGVNVANQIFKENLYDISDWDFGNKNYFLAGDCGAFKTNLPYIKTVYKNSFFICSGIGSKIGNNVINLNNNFDPIFFDKEGNIVNHTCKDYNGFYSNIITICLPNIEEYDGMWKNIKILENN